MTPETAEAVAREYLAIEAREQAMAQTVWGPELDAERHEDEVVRLWDALNASLDRWKILAEFPVQGVRIPELIPADGLSQGIRRWRGGPGTAVELDSAGWKQWIQGWSDQGWTVAGSYWALVEHVPADGAGPARSQIEVTGRLENVLRHERAVVRARVTMQWASDSGGTPVPDQATVQRVELLTRSTPPPFGLWMEADLTSDPGTFNDPMLVRDLNRDGRPDLLLVGGNTVWMSDTNVSPPFRRQRAGPLPTERIQAAVLSDVNGDHREDLVLAGRGGVQWLSGEVPGTFDSPQIGWTATTPLKHPQALAAGDVNGDGAPDLWVIQYKLPYQQGQFPTPWFDARDGFPSFLLLNDGRGGFREATLESGLGSVGNRRAYSASWIDLDHDGDLDLVQVSDFAGLDLLLNDGFGHFTAITETLGDTRHGFGMAHVVNDLNRDGWPDLLMLGMGSTVADRLRAAGLDRRVPGEGPGKVLEMTRGNRLFLGGRAGPLPMTPTAGASVAPFADTGWTWGAAWEDFDHDGRLDLAVANGHETRASAADYERQFWLHDRFVAGSTNHPAAEFYFRTAAGRRHAARASYGGWQDNQFRLSTADGKSPDVAWLLGVAVAADCRNLVATDLDLDGRLDLIVTTQEEWPRRRQRLLVFRNGMETGSWIGFHLLGAPQPGTRVELLMSTNSVSPTDRVWETPSRWLINGDSFRSQGSASVHFGLGNARPSAARIHWAGGGTATLESPEINRWHWIPDPSGINNPAPVQRK